MQGFNRYHPPDYDPKQHDSLNAYHGKHALGDRARKLDQGILIVRFELPFNIWCGGCKAHIGMGVRYNAEKKKVGNYYSTPIYSFRCKCHLCGHWFSIETDPKNTRYVVTEGAKQQATEFDEEDNGGIVLDNKDPSGAPPDPFAALEKKQTDKQVAVANKDRLEELYEHSDSKWSDPFTLSQKLRSNFRTEKASLISRSRRDDAVRARYSLPADIKLGDEDGEPGELAEVRKLLENGREEREAKRRKLKAETGHGATPVASSSRTIGSDSRRRASGPSAKDVQVADLRSRLRLSHKIRTDPFLSDSTAARPTVRSGKGAILTKKRRQGTDADVHEQTALATAEALGVAGYTSD